MLWFALILGAVSADKYAVLVAGSNGYYNYRHQADVSHAYHILVTEGQFKKENVVLMMYDDVAHSDENPHRRTLVNHPNGSNVYPGLAAVDYRGEDCNADNVLGVLNGTAKGKTLQSGPNDDVFFYFADHGAPGLVAMPVGDPLYADDFLKALNWMSENNRFHEMVVYIEACESGSMLAKLNPNIHIYGTTAATGNESSYATYWSDEYQTYLGDEYSVAWMEDSELYWKQDLETLLTQYEHVQSRTNHSHPQIYGDQTISHEKVREFQDELTPRRRLDSHFVQEIIPFSDTHDVVINTLSNRALLANNPIDFLIQRKRLEKEYDSRMRFDTIFQALIRTYVKPAYVDDYLLNLQSEIDYPCLKVLYPYFEKTCSPFTDYGRKYVTALINICPQDDVGSIKQMISHVCGSYFGPKRDRA